MATSIHLRMILARSDALRSVFSRTVACTMKETQLNWSIKAPMLANLSLSIGVELFELTDTVVGELAPVLLLRLFAVSTSSEAFFL
jgi:hypothetical protein